MSATFTAGTNHLLATYRLNEQLTKGHIEGCLHFVVVLCCTECYLASRMSKVTLYER